MKHKESDFMADSLFHGLKSLFGDDVVDVYPQWYMYDNFDKSSLLTRFHGRGFTLCGSVRHSDGVDRTDIENKIKTNYFDLIVYGAVYRNLDFLELVISHYDKNKIIFIDGHEIVNIHHDLVDRGLYFKMTIENEYKNIIPINLSIPKEKIYTGEIHKDKLLGTVIPGAVQTFIYNDENEYYKDYQASLFGYTWKKACWESMRHCEIMMNRCVPLFVDIKHCPSQSLQKLPKSILTEVFDIFVGFDKSILDSEFIYGKHTNAITNFDLNTFNDLEIDYDRYYEINDKLYSYLINNLTTEHTAKNIIEHSNS